MSNKVKQTSLILISYVVLLAYHCPAEPNFFCYIQTKSIRNAPEKIQTEKLINVSLKCIWNEIFDNNFIVLLESALKDKINAVYRL